MLSNFHTHTIYCDGKSTAEEIVQSAIKKGFDAIGFSGHGFTDHDLSYCMKDTVKYLSEVRELAKEYSDRIEVYSGVEEDASFLLDRTEYDYIIGMDKSNMADMREIMSGDPQNKLSLMLDWCGEHRDVADPWYTRDFRATENDVDRGCAALLDKIL